jgi:protein SCO1/2
MNRVSVIVFGLLCFSHWASQAQVVTPETGMGIDEKLGNQVPLGLTFRDENGEERNLSDFLDVPVVLSLVYYRCPGICSPLMSGIADVLGKTGLGAGKDFRVLTVSFDPRETPDLARDKKKNYMKALPAGFPEAAWSFLVADSSNVALLTEAVGFRFKREGNDFLHPASLIVLSPKGKIVRYIYGITFLPFEVKMAVLEASEGKVGPTVSRVLLYCYSYDPEGRRYVFDVLKVSGIVILFFAAAFIAYLTLGGRKRQRSA